MMGERTCLSSIHLLCAVQHTLAEEVEFGLTEHLPFDEFELLDLLRRRSV
jgi:hypothetical protein